MRCILGSMEEKSLFGARSILIVGVGALLLLGVAYFLVGSKGVSPTGTGEQGASASSTENMSSATLSVLPGSAGMTGNAKVELVKAPQAPSLASPKYSGDITEEQWTSIAAAFKKTQDAIAKNVQDFKAWIQAGTLYKDAGDYAMAAKVWEYASVLAPTNIVSPLNLGDLYANYVKDYPKAEKNYLQEIANNQNSPLAYRALYELYTETSYKPSATAAEDILRKGIAANPQATDLQVLLARYYAQSGRKEDAKMQYEAAIASADKQDNVTLVAQLKTEEAGL